MEKNMRVILASASPRRRELLGQLGVEFEVCPSKGEEVITKTKPEDIVKELACQKAREIADSVQREYININSASENDKAKSDEEEICGNAVDLAKINVVEEAIRVIGADTIVVYEDTIFGKPVDEEDALRMLTTLQGNTHQVYTGVCVINIKNGVREEKVFAEKTDVIMYPVSKEEILAYIATGEHKDKAGSYAIQGISGKFIKGIVGDYYNVVGLPMARLYQECFREV